MVFINSYKPPNPATSSVDVISKEPYDINFSIPLPPTLETPRVRLTPFIPSIYAEPFFSAFSESPELSRYLPIAFSTCTELVVFLDNYVRLDPSCLIFAIIDKVKEKENGDIGHSLAGMIGVLNCSSKNLAVEIGPVIILKAFQRTFVASNAIGLILRHWLSIPSEGGLGFRRICWTANPYNEASIRTAERMGLKKEGVLRWTWCLPENGVGKEAGEGRGERRGRDSVLLSICWDDWENGGREHVEKVIARV
ncbi:acyl-CoA N-acyltransferase [Collybia nuda]|uniref:Acyl-CoA N-acyltransferase n=1 Tax=Collybia nuda TaxID=64659 RepID=A0A9P5YG88_9AGAR|nr:acyl-CoA N-acyltransferase [Collybia nuda]